MSTTITFLGADETVTGSRYLVETDEARVLVDCGLLQGWKRLRERNWLPLPFAPASLDAVAGADEIKVRGQYVRVRARVAQIQGLSAHADYHEMLQLLSASELSPSHAFVTHGEPALADAFRRRLKDTFGWEVSVPEMGETVALGAGEVS